MALWVGSYSKAGGKGLYRLEEGQGRLNVADIEPRIANASFGVVSRHGMAYFVDEQDEGRITAWRHHEGWLRMSSLPSGGAAPCYLALSHDERWLACANYDDGVVALFRLDPSSGDLLELSARITQHGAGPDPERQDGPHAHCVLFASDGSALYHVDLGLDRVFRHDLENGNIVASHLAFATSPGAGPRHLMFHPDGAHALLICELSAQLLLLRHGSDGSFTCIDATPTTPKPSIEENLGGHLAIDAKGRVLITNRGHDSLVRFTICRDKLEMLDWHHTGGTSPRHFVPSQDGALIAHEESGTLTQVLWGKPSALPVATIPGAAFVIDIPD